MGNIHRWVQNYEFVFVLPKKLECFKTTEFSMTECEQTKQTDAPILEHPPDVI